MSGLQNGDKKYKFEKKIKFERKQDKRGKYQTYISVVDGERGRSKSGILHKIDYDVHNRFVGDVPSLNKALDAWSPESKKGKFAKATLKTTNFVVRDVGRTAFDVGLAAETATIKTAQTMSRSGKRLISSGWNRLENKIRRESSDDAGKAALTVASMSISAVGGIKRHSKQKKQFLREKSGFQLKKEKYKLSKRENYNPKFKENKKNLKAARKSYKEAKANLSKAELKGKKKEFKVEKKAIAKSNKNTRIAQRSEKISLNNQKKIAKLSKPAPLALKSIKYTGRKMIASSYQKAIYADEKNDMLRAIDFAATRVIPGVNTLLNVKNPISKETRLTAAQNKSYFIEKKQSKRENRLKKQESKLKDRKNVNRSKPKNKKSNAQAKAEEKSAQAAAEAMERAQRAVKAALASISKGVATAAVPTIAIIIAIALVIFMLGSLLIGIFSNGGWIMGTYTASDHQLVKAEEQYTKLAYELNEKILRVGSDDWKQALKDLGAIEGASKFGDTDPQGWDDEPDTRLWGQSGVFNYLPVYDYDQFKLLSFLCAYYYKTDDDGNVKYWTYKNATTDLIKELFYDEYEFEYWYDNTSGWVELPTYTFFGGGSGSNDPSATYYTISDGTTPPTRVTGNDNYTYKIHPEQYPAEIASYLDSDGWLYFKRYNNEYRIVNCNEVSSITGNWKLTPYIIPDTRYYCGTVEPFYYQRSDGTFAFNPTGRHEYERSYRYWTNSDGTTDEAWFAIPPDNAYCWNSSIMGKWLCYYCEKYEWKTDCRLYYNVKQKKTFDEAIRDKLLSMEDGEYRYEIYQLYSSVSVGSGNIPLRGNHQSFASPVDKTVEQCITDGEIINYCGYDMQKWGETHCSIDDKLHKAIDIKYGSGKFVYAGFSGTIDTFDQDKNLVVIKCENYNYWYDGNGDGKKRDTKIYYYNVHLKSTLSVGDTVEKGEYFAMSLSEKNCRLNNSSMLDNSGVSDSFLHIEVEFDTAGIGWKYVDPLLMFR